MLRRLLRCGIVEVWGSSDVELQAERERAANADEAGQVWKCGMWSAVVWSMVWWSRCGHLWYTQDLLVMYYPVLQSGKKALAQG